MLPALEQWVEQKRAPDRIVANRKPDWTHPLCPYPQVATYQGKGKRKGCGKLEV